jgi:pyruvate dehydrogenase E1 component alpha subunit
MAEILGKTTGYCKGRGGSMHMADVANGNLGGNGIVGGGLPMSVGVGLSIRMRKSMQVCLCIFGDGAANEGAFHEVLNMASIYRLPVIYLCENNQYAMSTPVTKAFNVERIGDRACAYGIPGVTVDGNELVAVYEAVNEAANRARRGEGPTLIECVTYRYKGHSRSDRQVYRTRDEIRDWMELRDPITRFAQLMIQAAVIGEAENTAISDQAKVQVEQAIEFAITSPDPDADTVLEFVYA